MKKINSNEIIIGPCLYLNDERTLVAGDLHIGSDESLAASGAFSPVLGLNEIKDTFNKVFDFMEDNDIEMKRLVLLGDIEVSFKFPSYREVREIKKFFSWFEKKFEKIVVIKGNHDLFLDKIINKEYVKRRYSLGNYAFLHGDKILETKKKNIIIGHEHPAIKLSDEVRHEKYKCFLFSYFKNKRLITLPSVNQLSIGTDLVNEKLLSPFLKDKVLQKAKIYLIENMEIYDFGKLKNIF
ncbi:MAG: metallophosphoesterase [Nanobdellota archaeon]